MKSTRRTFLSPGCLGGQLAVSWPLGPLEGVCDPTPSASCVGEALLGSTSISMHTPAVAS